MEYKIIKKKDISEVIDSYGELIGRDDVPKNGADLESQANNTTDYNAKVHAQPFRYDMLGRFGFTMLPFFESEEEPEIDDSEIDVLNDLAKLMYEKYKETLEYYFRNPNKLKSDFRLHSEVDFDSQPEEKKKIDYDWAKKIIALLNSHMNEVLSPEKVDASQKGTLAAGGEGLDEAIVQEKVLTKKDEDELANKSDSKEVREKKIEKIAGLINKLDKKDVDKLINLLERK